MQLVTTEDLLRFLYDEMPPAEAQQVAEALDASWSLREKFRVLQESKERLDRARLPEPSAECLDRLFLYALAPNRVETES